MNIEQTAEKFFRMSDEVWAKHANPWSVWTRYSCLPLLVFAIWSRVWLGWFSVLPIIAVCFWTWFNPRVFGKPKTTNHWASKAVLGERILLKHAKEKIPAHHRRAIGNLKIITSIGFFLAVYGLYALQVWYVVLGTVIVILGKTWFLDRMVWLYQDLRNEEPEYQSWLY